MARALVTGGAGFIGSHLVRRLVAAGHQVTNLDRLTYAGSRESLAHLADSGRHRLVVGDVRDTDLLGRLFVEVRPEWVLHLAAESHVDRSIAGAEAFVETNIVGTFRLLDASLAHWRSLSGAEREGFRFLQVSTDEVHGSLGPDDPPFNEVTPLAPRSPYSASKAAAEHLVAAWHATHGLPTVTTRCSNNLGPFQFPEKLIPVVILSALSGRDIPVYGRGDNIRDWMHVDDHVEGLLAAVRLGRPGRTYLLGGGNELGNLQLVRLICEILDKLRPRPDGRPHADAVRLVRDRPGHDLRYAVDCRRAREELGWRPRIGLDDALRSTVEWYLENEAWWRAALRRNQGTA